MTLSTRTDSPAGDPQPVQLEVSTRVDVSYDGAIVKCDVVAELDEVWLCHKADLPSCPHGTV